MGESPQEKASKQQVGVYGSLYNDIKSTDNFAKVAPEFDKVIANLYSGFGQIKGGITNTMSRNVGESLVTSGVARGQDQGGAWINAITSALTPAISNLQTQVADIGKAKSITYADILNRKDVNLMNILGGQTQAIGGMKDTTGMGDVMGFVQSLASIISAFVNPGGVAAKSAASAGTTVNNSSDLYRS